MKVNTAVKRPIPTPKFTHEGVMQSGEPPHTHWLDLETK